MWCYLSHIAYLNIKVCITACVSCVLLGLSQNIGETRRTNENMRRLLGDRFGVESNMVAVMTHTHMHVMG